jgi:hypothetical protein
LAVNPDCGLVSAKAEWGYGGGLSMKIYILLALISVILGVSNLPLRRPAKAVVTAPPDSVTAGI